MKNIRLLLIPAFITILFFSCEKWTDADPPVDPRITERKYCNDPEALNYNWDFPGLPDSTVCIFPTDLFKGNYTFLDSVYSADNSFDSANSLITYSLQIISVSKNKFTVAGFCSAGNSLSFTAERSTYRANADTTIQTSDTTFGYGQFFCRTLDTLTGYLTKDRTDNTKLYIEFSVVSDTGINFHKGTAVKQF